MPITIEILKQAEKEATEARRWYADRSAQAAGRFLASLDRAKDAVVATPLRWPVGIRNTRKYRLARFPFVMIYLFDGSCVRIIAIAHLKRRPNYWRTRI